MKPYLKIATLCFLSLLCCSAAMAGGVYQQPDEFIKEVFDGNPPKAEVLWLTAELKEQVTEILDHKYRALRVRYWRQQNRLSSN